MWKPNANSRPQTAYCKKAIKVRGRQV